MLATGRSLPLVSALVALTFFVIMETSVVSSYSAYLNADYYSRMQAVMEKYYARQQEIATKYADKGSAATRPISGFDLLAEMDSSANNASSPVNIDAPRLYEEESGSSPPPLQAHRQIRDAQMNYSGYEDDIITTNSDGVSALTLKLKQGDCHTGSLTYKHVLNLDVYRSSSVEADVPVSLDDSYCIACISVKPRNSHKSTLDINITKDNGRNTVKLTATGSCYKNYEFLQIDIKIYQIRKRGQFCD